MIRKALQDRLRRLEAVLIGRSQPTPEKEQANRIEAAIQELDQLYREQAPAEITAAIDHLVFDVYGPVAERYHRGEITAAELVPAFDAACAAFEGEAHDA